MFLDSWAYYFKLKSEFKSIFIDGHYWKTSNSGVPYGAAIPRGTISYTNITDQKISKYKNLLIITVSYKMYRCRKTRKKICIVNLDKCF